MQAANRDKLIVALDFPAYDDARHLVDTLGDTVSFYKVGLELLFHDGLALASELKNDGKRVFLDMKFLDIANTVEKAVAAVAGLGFDFLTIHGTDTKTMAAAVKGRGNAPLKLLAVTVLTSLDQTDLADQGIAMTPQDLVLKRARLALDAGIDGVIASGQEAAAIRAATAPNFLIVTPGIRMPGGEAGDQKRITTPDEALRAGANHIVVGRPITAASNPKSAAESVLQRIALA
ncbi:MAG: orotidine-5'-phosphate decarboxylase [Hyphomicrobium sp.]|jgi:orotidine-5'-phosphate decarboxylase|nr:orotidine-5'-phosphate decarboxylase [Hyphomicrobium sp.]